MSNFNDLFKDRNDINEKVIIGYISFCIMVIFAILDIVSGYFGQTLTIHQYIFDSFLYLTLGTFGISSVDKYTNKRNSSSDIDNSVSSSNNPSNQDTSVSSSNNPSNQDTIDNK